MFDILCKVGIVFFGCKNKKSNDNSDIEVFLTLEPPTCARIKKLQSLMMNGCGGSSGSDTNTNDFTLFEKGE